MPCHIAILISGRGSNMTALADAVQQGAIPEAIVRVCISDRADATGRARAVERGIETLVIERQRRTRAEHEAEIIRALEERAINLVCLAGFMRLLSPAFVALYRNRILNIHPSLLPAFPGLHAQRQALAYGVRWTGCTVHFVDETLDGGPVIEQRLVPVLDDDTEETLSARILTEEHRAYTDAVARIVRGNYEIMGRRVINKSSP